jgi:cell division protein DivIC
MKGQEIWKKILPWVRNKFILTTLVFFLWLLIFDRSNWFDMISEIRTIHNLEKEKEYYLKKIDSDNQKFAREQYLMKKPDEDIFVIEE